MKINEVNMPTKHPRINITLEQAVAGLLSSVAKHENKSVSSMVGMSKEFMG